MERSFDAIDCAISIADGLELITVISFVFPYSRGCLSGSAEIHFQNLLHFIHYRIDGIDRKRHIFTASGKNWPLLVKIYWPLLVKNMPLCRRILENCTCWAQTENIDLAINNIQSVMFFGLCSAGYFLLATSCWLLPTGYFLLATSYWLFSTGYVLCCVDLEL
jgi:hypothetical protein